MPTFNVEQNQFSKWINFISLIFFAANFNFAFLITAYCAYAPREAIFLGRWIPKERFSYFPHTIIVTIFHSYLMLILAINQAITCILFFSNMFYMTIVLSRELNLNLKFEKHRTNSRLRSVKNIQHTYRSFQVLMEQWNCVLGLVLYTGNLVFVGVPVLFNVIMFHFWKQLEPIARATLLSGMVVVCTVWFAVLQCGKYFWLQGRETLQSWKVRRWTNDRDNKIMRKFHKSCRLVLLRYGKALVLARVTQFLYVIGLLKWTFKMSLAMKH